MVYVLEGRIRQPLSGRLEERMNTYRYLGLVLHSAVQYVLYSGFQARGKIVHFCYRRRPAWPPFTTTLAHNS